MTDQEWHPLTANEKAQREEQLNDNYFDALWDNYCRTGDLEYLILFIRRGGDISDDKTRYLIADLLGAPPQNPGGSKPLENIRFYNHVKMLQDVKGMGVTKAVKYVAEVEGISISGGWARYRAGGKT